MEPIESAHQLLAFFKTGRALENVLLKDLDLVSIQLNEGVFDNVSFDGVDFGQAQVRGGRF